MKKTFLSISVALLLLILVAGTAFANSAPWKQVHFKGSLQEVENDEVLMPIIYLHGNGTGNAGGLGQFSLHFEGIVHNDANGVGIAVEGAHYTAANGDILFATGTGIGAPSNTPGVNKIVEKYTITGGTGRFADANGNFTVERLVNLPTGVSSGTVEGNIRLH